MFIKNMFANEEGGNEQQVHAYIGIIRCKIASRHRWHRTTSVKSVRSRFGKEGSQLVINGTLDKSL